MMCGARNIRIGRKVMEDLIKNKRAFEWIKERAKIMNMSVIEYCGTYRGIVYKKMEEKNNERSK